MTLSEFKAWFEGFSEIMEGPPNETQWNRIKARVSEIDNKPVSYPVYIDRYVAPYRRWLDSPTWLLSGSSAGSALPANMSDVGSSKVVEGSIAFDSVDEMKRAGRAEYLSALS